MVNNDRLGTTHNVDNNGDCIVIAVNSLPIYNQDSLVKSNRRSIINLNLNNEKKLIKIL
jgi:hypothetical protein